MFKDNPFLDFKIANNLVINIFSISLKTEMLKIPSYHE